MSFSSVTRKIVDERLKSLNVAFLAEILLLNEDRTKAKIQPLGMRKNYGGTAQKQNVITGVHIARSARYKLGALGAPNGEGQQAASISPVEVGDIVLCVCCDRNIADALNGNNVVPPVGYHNKSDCVIVSII